MRDSAAVLLAGGALLVFGAASAQALEGGDLLGSTLPFGISASSLVSLNQSTGDETVICGIGDFGHLTHEIEFRDDGALFAVSSSFSQWLITLDPTNCDGTLVGELPANVAALEFVGSTLYAAMAVPAESGSAAGFGSVLSLVTLDTTNAATAEIGAMGYAFVGGLAYDPATQTMYGVGAPEDRGSGHELFIVDLTNGQTTPIGPTGLSLGALEMRSDGTLFAGDTDGTPSLFTIDPATGVATEIGPTGGEFSLSGLAFVPGGGATVLEVPTLSVTGLVAFAALVFAAAVAHSRRNVRRSS